MKKRLLYFLIIGIIFFIPKNVFAVSVSTSCSGSSSATLGNTVTVTVKGNASDSVMWDLSISYDSSKLQYVGGNATHYISDDFSSSLNLTYKFKTISLGNAYVKVANAEVATASGDSTSSHDGICNINIVKQSSTGSTNIAKSSDNNLKSLFIDGANLNPEFNKDTLEYSIELPYDTTKIKVNAEKNDSKANVRGVGEIDVKEGQNKIEIVVTAENGSTKTYIINALVKEKDPIKVKVAGEEYTIVRKLDDINIPINFEKKTIKILDDDIETFYNKKLKYTLVALKNKKGDISLFKYDEVKNIYDKYLQLKSKELNIVLTKLDNEKDIPNRYHKVNFDYNGTNVEGYALNKNSDFRLVYGVNIENGDEGFYLYDLKENTIQRFYNEQLDDYSNLIDRCKLVFIVLGSFIILLTIIIIVLLSKNVKFKTMYLNKRLNPIDNPNYNSKSIKYQDLEGTISMNKIQNSEGKSKKKSKEKTFLDE
ncbi:MAG: cadherin-like beta sandwich domain-containing protein [Bacilli bacterium]|nr:cadherin-like beta sandwich domain-containing protein [Bacilli bacterium]